MGVKNDNPNDYFMDSRLRVPDKRSGWVKFKEAIYNPETGEVLGRSKKLWGMSGIFYLIFYTVLAILCALCGMGLMATIDEHQPKYILEESLIGTNPGLGFRPSPDLASESLIWYNTANTTEITGWINRINKFLEKYIDSRSLPQGGRNQEVCDYGKLPKEGNVCSVFLNNLGICSPTQNYGYHNSAPCVFIKLNRIYGWIPEYYNDTNNLPSDMPEDLVEHIQAVAKSSPEKLNTVWVSCTGENPHDKENIGLVEYYPIRGFPSYYFPYKNVPGYLSPIVAVNFKRPAKNIIINIECRAWAKNIKYNKSIRERTGMVHFEIQVDNKPPEEKS